MSSYLASFKKMAADGAAKAKSASADAMDKSKVLAAKGKQLGEEGFAAAQTKANQAADHMKRASVSASKAASCMKECSAKCTAQGGGRRTRRRRGGKRRKTHKRKHHKKKSHKKRAHKKRKSHRRRRH